MTIGKLLIVLKWSEAGDPFSPPPTLLWAPYGHCGLCIDWPHGPVPTPLERELASASWFLWASAFPSASAVNWGYSCLLAGAGEAWVLLAPCSSPQPPPPPVLTYSLGRLSANLAFGLKIVRLLQVAMGSLWSRLHGHLRLCSCAEHKAGHTVGTHERMNEWMNEWKPATRQPVPQDPASPSPQRHSEVPDRSCLSHNTGSLIPAWISPLMK